MAESRALRSVIRLGGCLFGACLVGGCVLGNPGFDESESGETSASTGSTVTVTGPSGSASASVTSGGSESSGVSASGGTTTGAATTDATTGEATASGTTGAATTEAATESDGGTSTGGIPELSCSPEKVVDVPLLPTENTYVVTSAGATCSWTDSNLIPVNTEEPCEILNFGGQMAKFTVIGRDGDSRGEYLVRFGVHQALLAYPGMGIASADLTIVPWWSKTRSDVLFTVGVVDYDDVWVVGDKVAQPAVEGDSSWMSRRIEGGAQPWSSGDGPAAASVEAATISLDELIGGEHPEVTSTAIPGSLLAPWVSDAGDEQGFVIHTELEPILVKNKDTPYPPVLRLHLCPL